MKGIKLFEASNNYALIKQRDIIMPSESESFMTVDNMLLCIDVFDKYMKDKYDFDIINDARDTNVKQVLYKIMNQVEQEYRNELNLKDKNNVVLNIARDHYKQLYKLAKKSKKINVKNLQREQEVFGTRSMNMTQIKPQALFERGRSTENEYKHLEEARKQEIQRAQPKFDDPVTEDAFRPDDFMKKVADLTKTRGDMTSIPQERLQQDTEFAKRTISDVEPKDMYVANGNGLLETDHMPISKSVLRQEFVTNPTSKIYTAEKYFCINGFDRDWSIATQRFRFTTDFSANDNSIQHRYKNIKSLSVKRIIIPQEIRDNSSINNVPKSYYNYSFNFNFPYIFLQIDELDNVYDGTSETIRKGFTQMIVDKCYYAPNGRGYLVLQSMQDEKKVFQTPLSELSRLTISIRKPNGELFNESVDDLKVFKIEYELVNRQYLKIVTNKFFDKNEFYKGDTVVLKGYALTPLSPSMSQTAIKTLNDYINRPQGHEVIELGQANDSGYYRNFYIKAPGSFDESCGKFVVDSTLIDCLDAYNGAYDFNANPTSTNGAMLNMALQCVFSFKIEQIMPDPGRMELTAS